MFVSGLLLALLFHVSCEAGYTYNRVNLQPLKDVYNYLGERLIQNVRDKLEPYYNYYAPYYNYYNYGCKTTSGPDTGSQCQFPFKYQGQTYSNCAQWRWGGSGTGQYWCSTKTDRYRNHIEGQGYYGFCGEGNGCFGYNDRQPTV